MGVDVLPPEAEAKLQALLKEQRARNAVDHDHQRAKRSLWLAHHWPDEYERCAVVGGRHVCRRCLTLYPLAILTAVLGFAGLVPWPASLDLFFIWGLCLPATAEFLGEKLLGWSYNATRQVAVTALLAPAFGRGLFYEIQDRWSVEFWGPIILFGAMWGFAAVREARDKMFSEALERSIEFGDASGRLGDVQHGQ